MSFFDCLPTVEKCCFCISLKWGTVMIAIIGILNCCFGAVTFSDYSCTNKKNGLQISIGYFTYVLIVIDILLLIASILLLAGVFMKKPETATWFIIIAGLSAVIVLIFAIMTLIASLINTACQFRFVVPFSSIIGFLIWVYFIIVVKSYQPEMY